MDIAQGIQRSALIRIRKPRAVIPLLQEVPTAIQHPVKAHHRIPIQPMHNLGQILRLGRLQRVMHMVAHNAEGIELKPIFGLALADSIEQDIPTFLPHPSKVTIITAGGDVVAIARFQRSWITRYGRRNVSKDLTVVHPAI